METFAGYLGGTRGVSRSSFDPRGRFQTYPLVRNIRQADVMKIAEVVSVPQVQAVQPVLRIL
jgi:hypothetical protein